MIQIPENGNWYILVYMIGPIVSLCLILLKRETIGVECDDSLVIGQKERLQLL